MSIEPIDIWLGRQVLYRLKPHTASIVAVCGLAILSIVLGYAQPVLTKQIVDEGIGRGDVRNTMYIGGVLVVAMAMSILLEYAISIVLTRLCAALTRQARLEIVTAALSSGSSAELSAGEAISRVLEDASVFATFVRNVALAVLSTAISTGIAMVLMVQVSLLLWVVMGAIYLTMWLLSTRYARQITTLQRELKQAHAEMLGSLNSILGDPTTVRGLRLVDYYHGAAAEKIRGYEAALVTSGIIMGKHNLAMSAILALPSALTTLVGGMLAVQGSITVGALVAFNMVVMRFLAPSVTIARIRTEVLSCRAACERLMPYLTPDSWTQSTKGAMSLTGCRVVKEGRVILDDVSVELFQGDKVLVYGPNGAGKTTLLQSLAGISTEIEGQAERWQEAMYLPAHARLVLHGAVGDSLSNLAGGRERCEDILVKHGMNQHIHELWERAYDSLSEGQRKIVNLSVMVIQATRLGVEYVLVDEIDAHLDRQTRKDMISNFLGAPWTVVFTAHHIPENGCHRIKLYSINNGVVTKTAHRLSCGQYTGPLG